MSRTLLIALTLVPVAGIAQDAIKPIRLDGKGKSAVRNNLGVDSFLKGNLNLALRYFDESSLVDFGNPIPWINGALTNFELGHLAKASKANQQAFLMGDRTVRRLTLGVEIDSARGHRDKAWQQVLGSQFLQPDDPYVHIARAKFAESAGFGRMAERSKWQAYRSGLVPFLDSKPYPARAVSADSGLPFSGSLGGRVRALDDQSALLGRVDFGSNRLDNANQSAEKVEIASDSRLGVLMGSYQHQRGDRPGAFSNSNFFTSSPGTDLDLAISTLGWQRTRGPWTANLNYREAVADLRTASNLPYSRDSIQNQWMADLRYDQRDLTLGVSHTGIYRDSVTNPAVEPLEEVFAQGRTNLASAYATFRHSLTPNIHFTAGATLTSFESTTHGLVSGELAIRAFGNRILRIGAIPTMNRVGSSLFPEDLRATQLTRAKDRSVSATKDLSQTPPFFSPNGKELDLYAELPVVQSKTNEFKVRAFQTQFTHARFLSASADQAGKLDLTPIRKGTISGVKFLNNWIPTNGLQITASTTVQRSNGLYPDQRNDRVPTIPTYESNITADINAGDWSISLMGGYVGTRAISATKVNTSGTTETLTDEAPAVVGLDLQVSHPFALGSLTLSAYNLTRSTVNPGFAPNRTFRLSYRQRF